MQKNNIARTLELQHSVALIGPVDAENATMVYGTNDFIDAMAVNNDWYLLVKYSDLPKHYQVGLFVGASILVFSGSAILSINGVDVNYAAPKLFDHNNPSIVPIFKKLCEVQRPSFLRNYDKVDLRFVKNGKHTGIFHDVPCEGFSSYATKHIFPVLDYYVDQRTKADTMDITTSMAQLLKAAH